MQPSTMVHNSVSLCWVSLMLGLSCWVSLMLGLPHAGSPLCWVSLMLGLPHAGSLSCWYCLINRVGLMRLFRPLSATTSPSAQCSQ